MRVKTRGFTIGELIIVLTILVVICSFVYVPVRMVLSQTRFMDGARSVQMDLAKARLDALETGKIHIVRWNFVKYTFYPNGKIEGPEEFDYYKDDQPYICRIMVNRLTGRTKLGRLQVEEENERDRRP